MCHVGRQTTYVTFMAFYLYFVYVGQPGECEHGGNTPLHISIIYDLYL